MALLAKTRARASLSIWALFGVCWHYLLNMASTPAHSALTALKGQIPLIGLTGGIGSGKSAVAKRLAELGATVIDSDQIAHDITAPNGEAIAPIQARFGPGLLAADGSLDRSKMRHLAFNDPSALQYLEAITHPLIHAETLRQASLAHQNGALYLVFMVPLLVESGYWPALIDHLVVVDCPPELQIARVIQRSNLDRSEIEQIMRKQALREDRLAAADTILLNDGSLDKLIPQIDALHQLITKNRSKPSNSA
jgi:dephospho-CoA kinase